MEGASVRRWRQRKEGFLSWGNSSGETEKKESRAVRVFLRHEGKKRGKGPPAKSPDENAAEKRRGGSFRARGGIFKGDEMDANLRKEDGGKRSRSQWGEGG